MGNRICTAFTTTGLAAGVLLSALIAEPAHAQATDTMPALAAVTGDLVVQYDQVVLQPLDRPAAQIIIGNPSIAEVTLQDANMLAITGKTFGITNLIVLDRDNKQIWNSRLMVKTDDKVVTLIRGVGSSTYSCPPGARCQPMLKVGDEKEQFGLIATASSQKMKISEAQDTAQPTN